MAAILEVANGNRVRLSEILYKTYLSHDNLKEYPYTNYTQEATGHNKILNNVIKTIMAGKPAFEVYDFKNDQRLNTGYPIFLQGKPTYSIFIITPTSSIYSQINNVITTEKIEMFSLLAGITVAIVVLMLSHYQMEQYLDKEVKRRTKELDKSNHYLN
jgi:hypothetical protein